MKAGGSAAKEAGKNIYFIKAGMNSASKLPILTFKELFMQKFFSLIVISFFLSSGCLYAAPFAPFAGYALSVEPQAGFLRGQARELVFRDESSDSLESELLWDLKPLWYAGTSLEFSREKRARRSGFFFSLSFMAGLPGKSGVMEDRDWLGPSGELTNYSRHDSEAGSAVITGFSAGLDVPPPLGSVLAFRLSCGLSYMCFSWTARDGYFRYGSQSGGNFLPLNDADPRIPVSGSVVSYSQRWLYMPMGLSVMIFPGRIFSGSLSFYAGPVLKYKGEDEHHFRINTGYYAEFKDSAAGGSFLQPGGELLFSPSRRSALHLYASWKRLAAKPHGESAGAPAGYMGNQSWQNLGRLSGASAWMIDAGIGLRIRL
jgi:outer membrane protease